MPKKYKHIALDDRTLIARSLPLGYKPNSSKDSNLPTLQRVWGGPVPASHANLPVMAGRYRLPPDPLGAPPWRVAILPVKRTRERETYLSCRASSVSSWSAIHSGTK